MMMRDTTGGNITNPNMIIAAKSGPSNSSSSSVKKLEKQLKFKGNSLVLEESVLQSYLR